MAERVASVVAQFKADLSDAESAWAQFKSKVESSKLNVPVSPGFGGSGTTQTLSGTVIPGSGQLPASLAVPSLNVPSFADSLAQRVAMQQLSSSASAAAGFQEGLASPNWSYLFGNRAGVGVPQSPGLRGMRAFFIGGMLARSALDVAEAGREYDIGSTLAGKSFAAQYEASMSYRKRLAGSVPFIGAAYDLLEDPLGYEEAGGRLAIQGSKDSDEVTSMMRSSYESRTRMSNEYASLAAPAGYLRNKLEIADRFGPLASMDQEARRDREVEPLSKAHKTQRAAIENKFGEQISGVYRASGAGPGVGASMAGTASDLQRQMEEALRAEDASYHAAVKLIDDRYANIDKLRDAARKAADAANERERRADVGSLRRQISGGYTGPRGAMVDRMLHGQDLADPGDPEMNRLLRAADAAELSRFDLVSGNRFRVTTAANMMRARGDTFGAAVQMAGGAAFQEWANADRTQGGAALVAGFSGIYATFMEQMSGTSLAASGYATGADVNALLLARNPLGAHLKRLQADRDRLLFPLRNSTMPGAGMLRSGINRFFNSAEDVARMDYGDATERMGLHVDSERERLDALLRHDRVGADVSGIVSSAIGESTLARNMGFGQFSVPILQNALSQLKLTQQNFAESFHAVEVGQNFDTGSPRGQASTEQMMKDILGGIDKLTQSVKDATSAK